MHRNRPHRFQISDSLFHIETLQIGCLLVETWWQIDKNGEKEDGRSTRWFPTVEDAREEGQRLVEAMDS